MAWDSRATPRWPGRNLTVRPGYEDFAPRSNHRPLFGHHSNSTRDEIESLDSAISGQRFNFDNKLPASTPPSRRSLSLQDPVQEKAIPIPAAVSQMCSELSFDSHVSHEKLPSRYSSPSGHLWRYILLIAIPILIPPVLVLALILVYREHRNEGAFSGATPAFQQSQLYVFVHFRDTWLVFIVSVINFWTPVLASIIMAIFAPHIARRLRMASVTATTNHMPSPYEMRLIAGLCQSSPTQFFRAYRHCFWRRSKKATPALRMVASLSLVLNFLWIFSFVSVALVHYCTQTVAYQKIISQPTPLPSPGRGMSELCLNGDRTKTRYPCSFNYTNPDLPDQQRETWRLAHQESTTSLIQYVQPDPEKSLELAILTPQQLSGGQDIDFRARSIGVSTECSYITSNCNMRYAGKGYSDRDTYYTLFNCSNNFWGALGKFPVSSDLSTAAGDPDICPLCYKPAARVTLGYFTDSALQNPYNSIGYNKTTLSPSNDIKPLSDSELANPVHLGVAARMNYLGVGSKLNRSSDIFAGPHVYLEFALQCKLTTYDVEYTSIGGVIRDVDYHLSPNGTLLEIFHGSQFYQLTTTSTDDLQVIVGQAQLQPGTVALRQTFEHLFSTKILSVIGGILTPRPASTVQTRQTILVSQIPWPAIVGVVMFPAIYTIMGLCILYSVRKRDVTGAIEEKDRVLGEQISTAGEVWGAFFPHEIAVQLKEDTSPSSGSIWSTEETRIQVDSNDGQQSRLKLTSIPRSEVF